MIHLVEKRSRRVSSSKPVSASGSNFMFDLKLGPPKSNLSAVQLYATVATLDMCVWYISYMYMYMYIHVYMYTCTHIKNKFKYKMHYNAYNLL